jgi:outer membrane protein assembly factor BamB
MVEAKTLEFGIANPPRPQSLNFLFISLPMKSSAFPSKVLLPAAFALVGTITLIAWLLQQPGQPLDLRIPGSDAAEVSAVSATNPALAGTLTLSNGQPATNTGIWPQFRGPARDGIASESKIARSWDAAGPRPLWSVEVGDGYAGPAVAHGRVYLMDYDVEHHRDALRCLSLADGREIWRFSYPVSVKRNHGMSRTVPVIASNLVIAIGPKGHVIACNAESGDLRWTIDLVRDHGATVPEWYVGQCPLVDGDRVILAPGGPEVLLLAVDLATGKEVWRTPNPHDWKMTHASIMPVDFAGQRQYVYCANKGVVGVAAKNGAPLWETTDWKISIATVPSPCPLDDGKIFFSGGYNAGSLLLQLTESNGTIAPKTLGKFGSEIFGATQHTPLLHNGHLYGTRADGKFVCLTPEGKVLWTSGSGDNLGLGSFLLVDGLIFALNDSGQLRLIEASPTSYQELTRAQVLKSARESWGPMALADGHLLVRDLTRLVCLDVRP